MKRVLLVMPPFTQSKRAMKRCVFPLGIGYLAAILEKAEICVAVLDCVAEGYDTEVKHYDEITFGLSDDEIVKRIKQFNPTHVGVSSLKSKQYRNVRSICKIVKEVSPNAQVIVGGGHPSALSEQVLADPNIDTVVVGEGENIIEYVVKYNQLGIVKSTHTDIQSLPWPARHLFPMQKYLKINMPTSVYSPHDTVTQVEFTRGCPFYCCFCAVTDFKGKHRCRPVEDCLNEIEFLKDRYGIEELDLVDSNLIVNRAWTIQLLQGIEKIGITWANPSGIWAGGLDEELLKLIKSSGCYQITLAIESSTPRILEDVIHKPLKLDAIKPIVDVCDKIGLDIHAFFVTGFPEQTKEEMFNDYKFAKKMNFTSASFDLVSLLPGSEIYEQYKNKQELDLNDLEFRKASISHPTISKEELETMIHDFNRNFNSSLMYRKPKVFLKKYMGTAMRKFSWNVIRNLFLRQ